MSSLSGNKRRRKRDDVWLMMDLIKQDWFYVPQVGLRLFVILLLPVGIASAIILYAYILFLDFTGMGSEHVINLFNENPHLLLIIIVVETAIVYLLMMTYRPTK